MSPNKILEKPCIRKIKLDSYPIHSYKVHISKPVCVPLPCGKLIWNPKLQLEAEQILGVAFWDDGTRDRISEGDVENGPTFWSLRVGSCGAYLTEDDALAILTAGVSFVGDGGVLLLFDVICKDDALVDAGINRGGGCGEWRRVPRFSLKQMPTMLSLGCSIDASGQLLSGVEEMSFPFPNGCWLVHLRPDCDKLTLPSRKFNWSKREHTCTFYR